MMSSFLATILCAASSVQVGDTAPQLTATSWLNATEPQFAGKPVLVEFWGTWCGPCVAAMPHVQDLWTRYRDKGLQLAAISYEQPALLQGFLDKHSLTFPVASDPDKVCIDAFGIESWPTTFVLGSDGKVLYRGIPSGAEPFIQQALGLETSAAVLLTRYLDGSADARAMLELLARNASHSFDLANWARGHVAEPGRTPPKDAGALLSALVKDWDGPRRAQALADLAATKSAFDLLGWVSAQMASRFPVTDQELQELLDAERFAEVVGAIATRNPSKKALAKLKADDGLRDYCNERAGKCRENAELIVMLGHYYYGELQPPEQFGLPPGTAVRTDESKAHFTGVVLNTGETFVEEDFPACIEPFLAGTLVVESMAKRKLPDDVAKAAAKRHAELLVDLAKKYGNRKKPAEGAVKQEG